MTIANSVAKHFSRAASIGAMSGVDAMASTRRLQTIIKNPFTLMMCGLRASTMGRHDFREYYKDCGLSPIELDALWFALQD